MGEKKEMHTTFEGGWQRIQPTWET